MFLKYHYNEIIAPSYPFLILVCSSFFMQPSSAYVIGSEKSRTSLPTRHNNGQTSASADHAHASSQNSFVQFTAQNMAPVPVPVFWRQSPPMMHLLPQPHVSHSAKSQNIPQLKHLVAKDDASSWQNGQFSAAGNPGTMDAAAPEMYYGLRHLPLPVPNGNQFREGSMMFPQPQQMYPFYVPSYPKASYDDSDYEPEEDDTPVKVGEVGLSFGLSGFDLYGTTASPFPWDTLFGGILGGVANIVKASAQKDMVGMMSKMMIMNHLSNMD